MVYILKGNVVLVFFRLEKPNQLLPKSFLKLMGFSFLISFSPGIKFPTF